MASAKPRTLFDKIWDSHVVETLPDGTCILYIDRHLVHEVTSPQAFEGLRMAGRKVRRPDCTIAVADHNIPTVGSRVPGFVTMCPSLIFDVRSAARASVGIDSCQRTWES